MATVIDCPSFIGVKKKIYTCLENAGSDNIFVNFFQVSKTTKLCAWYCSRLGLDEVPNNNFTWAINICSVQCCDSSLEMFSHAVHNREFIMLEMEYHAELY